MKRFDDTWRRIWNVGKKPRRRKDVYSRRRSAFESLERREVLAAFTVTLDRFLEIDNPDGDFDDGDYYAVVRVNSFPEVETEAITGSDIYPDDWVFTFDIPVDVLNVEVYVSIYDEDGALRFGDDTIDINSTRAGASDLHLTVNRQDGSFTGDASSLNAAPYYVSGNADGGGLDRGRLFFTIDTDGDGDGLMNSWESNGLDVNKDGVIDLDLPALGANPRHKDLFIEVDAMQFLQAKPLSPITQIFNSTPIRITANTHGLTTGTQITIAGAPANTNANGTWNVTRLNAHQFTLDSSTGNSWCLPGACGTWSLPAVAAAGLATNTSLDLVIDSFLKAPVSNPDGAQGINLHLQVDEQSLPFQSWNGDADGDGIWPYGEDLNGNTVLDINEPDVAGDGWDTGDDTNGNGRQDAGEPDVAGNGWDTGDDRNGNGTQQMPWEDVNRNGVLDPGEDLPVGATPPNGCLNSPEDANNNCRLDGAEDINNNGLLDPGEDIIVVNGWLDPAEDHNGNGRLDTFEDADNDAVFDNGDTDDQGGWLQFRAFKQTWFGTAAQRSSSNAAQILQAKRMVYRYSVLADFRVDGETTGVKTGSSGVQWGNSNANFIVTLGGSGGSQEQQAATLMHEFGHALGLGHGGSSGTNYKPNYHSNMSYTWQFSKANYDASWELDWSIGDLPNLDERFFREADGINGPAAHNGHQTRASHPVTGATIFVNETGAVDWNGDGDFTDVFDCITPPLPTPPPPCFDLNRFPATAAASLGEMLTDNNDWANITYAINRTQALVDPPGAPVEHTEFFDLKEHIESQQFTLAGNPLTRKKHVAADGTLTLFMGPYASLRSVHYSVQNEQFTVEHVAGSPSSPAGETVRVSAFGYVQEFTGVKRIVAEGGAGADMILLGETVLSPAELRGGEGNDFLQGGVGVDSIYGDGGNDVIIAGGAIGNELVGGEGNDRIVGADAGADTDPNFADNTHFGDAIDAGAGDDTIFGLGGADRIEAGIGNDWVDSGIGSDWVRGGVGDDYLYAGHGLGDLLAGEAGSDTIYGSHEGNDTISGGDDDDQLYGQGGNDRLDGDLGNDFLDGGTGIDVLHGGDGDDEILGGGGAGDALDGGAGDDILRGSNDGGDLIVGGAGRNRMYGNGGNDSIDGGAEDDMIDGGAGDDTIAGYGGSDLIVGGADHDALYGHRATAAGDDHAVDYLYGDFGTNGNEAGSGRDRLFGQGGNDLMFGEGADDAIDTSGGDFVDYGSGEGANPADFVAPTPTAPPTLIVGLGISQSGPSLPNGADSRGRWSEFDGSASGGGLSNSLGMGLEPSIAVATDGTQFVAWVDNRHGNYEVYVARNSSAAGWQELAASASAGGVSNTAGSSRRPSIILGADQQPIVVWTETMSGANNIRAAKFDPSANSGSGGWVALGTSLSANGISGTGSADMAQVALTAAGPVVAWLDSSGGTSNVYVRRFSGGVWSGLGGASASSGNGVSGLVAASGGARDLALASDGTKVSAAWTVGFPGDVQLREFSGGTWNQLSGSASATGVSQTPGDSFAPTLAYHQGRIYLAWQETVGHPLIESIRHAEVYASFHNGTAWQLVAGTGDVSQSNGRATSPHFSTGGNELYLTWSDIWRDGRPGQANEQTTEVMVRRWDGTNFDAMTGTMPTESAATRVDGSSAARLAVDASGNPYVVWTDRMAQRSATSPDSGSQVVVRGNRFDAARVFVADATHPVQAILDGNDLGPGDVIYIYGSVTGFALANDDAGVLVAGVPDSIQGEAVVSARVTGTISIAAGDLAFESFDVSGTVTVTGGARFTARDVGFDAGLTLNASSDAQVLSSRIAGSGVSLEAGSNRALIASSVFVGTIGVRIGAGGASDVVIRDNRFNGTNGIDIQAASGGRIAGNDIAATGIGLRIGAPFAGTIEANDIHGATTGVQYAASAALGGNRIHDNATGVVSSVAGSTAGLGFVGAAGPNQIYANTTGVQLTGQMQNQHVYQNATGVAGSGVLGGEDLTKANVVERNDVGVNFSGPIQFNRIGDNVTGLIAGSGQLIVHNVIHDNLATAIRVAGRTDVRIVQNTIVGSADLIRVETGSSNVEIRNNILWSSGGFDIFVANDSQSGFFSDFNDLHATETGKLVSWSGVTFTDIFDWQADVGTFDLHSIGRTDVNPRWSEPRFEKRWRDNFATVGLVAGQRFSSPTIDVGDPLVDRGVTATNRNLLLNGSFENLLADWATNPTAATGTSPAPFDGTRYFASGSAATGFADQTIHLLAAGFTAAELDSQDWVVEFGGRIRSAAETPLDQGQVTLQFYNASNALLQSTTVSAENVTDRWELVGKRVQLPAGTRSVTYRFETVRVSGATSDSFLDGAFVRLNVANSAPDLGAAGNTAADAFVGGPLGTSPHIALRSPDLYVDWERDKPHTIRWESFGNTGELPVRISLYQDTAEGPALVTTLAANAPDTGTFDWIPGNSGVSYGTTGLRIQVQLLGSGVALDRSAETFSVPENTNDFYVNDRDGSPTAGDNRNTGKSPSSPKPLPNNILDLYTLGSNQTLHIDAGNYVMLHPLLITNVAGLGDDEGFALVGPSDPQAVALLRHARPGTLAPVVELYDADFMSVSRIATDGGTYGVLVRTGSENFVASHLTTARASLDGLRLEANVLGSTLDHITATANGRNGISVEGPIDHIFDSVAGFNQDAGLRLYYPNSNSHVVRLEGNLAHDNRGSGIVTHNAGTTVIGNADLGLGRGNIVRDNAGNGIDAYNGTIQVVGNTVSGQRTAGRAGIYTGGAISKNVVFDNYAGIDGGSAPITNNRVYNNKTFGIHVGGGGIATGNVIHGNGSAPNPEWGIGIELVSSGATLTNNIVYNNTGHEIRIRGSANVVNNTVYHNNTGFTNASNGLHVEGQVSGVQLRNNIAWAATGFAVSVPANSQNGFQSDFNLLYATGTGQIGSWQGAGRATLNDWRNAAFTDQNSLSQNPQFVDLVDFHEQSLHGSYHGASLAPVRNATTGLPQMATGTLSVDGSQSPAIDRGAATDSFANEVSPNGGFINLGAYGNTAWASLSPPQYVLVMLPDGGEVWPAGQSFPIRWRSHNATGEVRLELVDTNNAAQLVIADPTPNDGEFIWGIPAGFAPGNYRVRVTRLDAGSQSDTSNNPFSIPAPVSVYYVNDNTVEAGDWTTAAGNDANDGFSPSTPKASIRALLEAYNLGPGDTLRVDAGTYNLTTNILITPDDSGVKIEGFHATNLDSDADPFNDNRSLRTILNRGNTAGGSYIFQFTGADDVTLSHLAMTGSEYAVVALGGADSDRIVLESNAIYNNYRGGVSMDTTNDQQRISGNRVFGSLDGAGIGIGVYGANGAHVSNNSVFNMYYGTGIDFRTLASATMPSVVADNSVYFTTTGINANGNPGTATVTVSGNQVHDNRFTGIAANVFANVIGNTVHDSPTGISAQTVRNNIVFGNQTGIDIGGSGIAEGNRAFNNSVVGIAAGGGVVQGNTLYSNNVGARLAGATQFINNLVYDNANDGIWVWRDSFSRIENNTIYQNGGGDAIQLGGPHPEFLISTFAPDRTTITNNILHVEQGYAMNFAADSGVGSTIDYNSLHITGSGSLARWQNRDFTSLADWYYELGFDQHSLTSDPQFVNPAGADGVMGYRATEVGAPRIVDNGDAGFSVSGPWHHAVQADGAMGDFLENTQPATARWVFTGSNPYPGQANLFVDVPISASWPAHPGLGTATYTHQTSASYTVTYNQGSGPFNVPVTLNFSGTIATIDQFATGSGPHALGTLHLGFPNVFAQAGFVGVTPITFTTTLRISSGQADVIADSATAFGTTIDDGDATFNKEGFNWVQPGRTGDYHLRPATSDVGAATWEFTGLTPGAYYNVAALWTTLPNNSGAAEFAIFDGEQAVRWAVRDLRAVPNDFTDTEGIKWNRLGIVRVTGDRLRVKLAGPGKLQADAIRIQELVGDHSADDDFHVATSSPTIDAGNPASAFASEPAPHGARINLGHTGNTVEATTSPAQMVQVLSPNGLEKLEQNQQIAIQWRRVGLPSTYLPDAVLADGPTVYYRLDETTGTTATDATANGLHATHTGGATLGVTGAVPAHPVNRAAQFDGVNDYIGVPVSTALNTTAMTLEAWINPDPTIALYSTLAMKSTSGSWNDGYGLFWSAGKLRFFVNHYAGSFVEANVATGSWSHIAATYDGTALRLYVNGNLAASAAYATPISSSAQPLQVGRGQGNYFWKGGIDEFAVFPTALTAGQIANHYSRQNHGMAKIELVETETNVASVLAAATPNDGDYAWTIPTSVTPGRYTIRVTADLGIQPSDSSDAPFVIASAGQHYYVNDGATAGDVFTTAIGDNANNGKTSATPMASIVALLAAYDLDGGDVIHVDAGTYSLVKNVLIDASDSGVRIVGPGVVGSASVATLNRGNTTAGSYAIHLTGADDVTIESLNITGGEYGVVLSDNTDSNRFTIANSEIHDNARIGVYVGPLNDDTRIEDNVFYNNRSGGVYSYSNTGTIVRDNVLHHNSNPGFGGTGIWVFSSNVVGNKSIIADNEIYSHDVGITVNGGTLIEVTGNLVHHNYSGIGASNNAIVSRNQAYFNQGYHWSIGYGIASSNATIVDNVTYDNDRGIDASGSIVRGNRIYHNRDTGIQAGGANQIVGNSIYGSNLGIRMGNGDLILNNLIYDHANDAIWTWNSNGGRIENNTIYATTGDAIQVGGPHADQFVTTFPSTNITIKNNILRVAQGYAIHVAADSELGFASDYNRFVLDGAGKLGRWEDRDFISQLDWRYELGFDVNSTVGDPQWIDIHGADNVLGYDTAAGIDRGLDDDFAVLTTSPTIDAGDPRSLYTAEPGPNGARANLGHTGNTYRAATSAGQLVQVLAPNGLEKYEAGQIVPIRWLADGLTAGRAVALIDASGSGAGSWSQNQYQIAGQSFAFTTSVNLSGVTNPAPASTYQNGTYGGFGAGNRLAYDLPVGDGNYTIRLHFVEPSLLAGQRLFDIKLNGTTVRTGFDIFAAAGGQFKATTLSFNVAASGGDGILLEMVNPSNTYGGYVTGIEVTAANPLGVASPKVDIVLSTNGGSSWTNIATNVDMDHYGRGEYLWTVGPETNGNTALIGVRSTTVSGVEDVSDSPFLIANAGNQYYVNDAATTGDVFTTAVGNNLNSGKSPNVPMASLRALLEIYDLDAGDVVHTDTGSYRVYRNLVLGVEESGVRIEGPGALPAGQATQAAATFNRGNTSSGSYVIELAGADDVTLDHLAATGAIIGVYAANGVQSERLTLSSSEVFAMGGSGAWGIYVGGGNVDAQVRGNRVHSIGGSNGGIYAEAARTRIEDNEVFGNNIGISAAYTGTVADRVVVSGNRAHGNTSIGIVGNNQVLLTGNTAYEQLAAGAIGIQAGSFSYPTVTTDNIVYNNVVGIVASSANGVPQTMQNNRAFNNTVGIRASGVSQILGNRVYSNAVGINGSAASGFYGRIANNLIYSNANQGIFIELSFGGVGEIVNNTIYQPVGEAIRLASVSQGMAIRNNILQIDSGYAIYVAANSQSNIVSNYNLMHLGGDANAHAGFWGSTARHTLADWQTASSQDANSLAADPMFVDRNGSDNALGYTTADRGLDDNFHLRAGSPAIDRGDRWNAMEFDVEGATRRDDPGTANAGRNDYAATVLSSSLFAATGVTLNWRSNDNYVTYTLPFSFPFYDGTYTTIYMSTEGFIQLGSATNAHDGANDTAKFKGVRRIAPLWDNLRTNGSGDDMFADATTAGQVTFRWNATNEANSSDVQFATTLFSDGRIRFDYGPGANLSPTVGLSMGNERAYQLLANFDGAATLSGANSVMWQLAPSYADIGAHEFRGSSLDMVAPTILGSTPVEVFTGGATSSSTVSSIRLQFSEEVDSIDARAIANYELRSPGPGGVYGDANDVVYSLRPQFTVGTAFVDLSIDNGPLSNGEYRLTVYSSANSSIHDLAGLQMDGDANGSAGGNFVRTFNVNSPPTLLGDLNGDHCVGLADLAILQARLGTALGATSVMGDLNGDGAVNRTDAALMAQVYGQCSVSPSPAAAPAMANAVIAGRISGADSSLNPLLAATRKAAAPRASAVDQLLASDAPLAASVPLRIRSALRGQRRLLKN